MVYSILTCTFTNKELLLFYTLFVIDQFCSQLLIVNLKHIHIAILLSVLMHVCVYMHMAVVVDIQGNIIKYMCHLTE